jgi:hypothetical protein
MNCINLLGISILLKLNGSKRTILSGAIDAMASISTIVDMITKKINQICFVLFFLINLKKI